MKTVDNLWDKKITLEITKYLEPLIQKHYMSELVQLMWTGDTFKILIFKISNREWLSLQLLELEKQE